ncbi:MAG: sugar phosphate isomerase/epimerase [Desulfobacterales bacterium]|nr:sugar phosphate isomerase/epimerase [Desulfobacterales bacterium]
MTDRKTGISGQYPYTPLARSYKNQFGFSVACPSFIYPDHILPNVSMLAPFMDEIEVLVFESAPADNLPPQDDIRQMAALAENQQISYNVHLPTDVNITDADPARRKQAIERIVAAADRARPLAPVTWTLHLPFEENSTDAATVQKWQKRAIDALKRLLTKSQIDPRHISIENLDYPPGWMEPLADAMDLSVCLDIGHLMEHGFDLMETFELFRRRITILHLYGGVAAGRGHMGLDCLEARHMPAVSQILNGFNGTVSLEVFSLKDLSKSLPVLERLVS